MTGGAFSTGLLTVLGATAVLILGLLLILLPVFVFGIYAAVNRTNRLLAQIIRAYGHEPEK